MKHDKSGDIYSEGHLLENGGQFVVTCLIRRSLRYLYYMTLKGTNTQHSGHVSQIFKTEKNDRNSTSQAN